MTCFGVVVGPSNNSCLVVIHQHYLHHDYDHYVWLRVRLRVFYNCLIITAYVSDFFFLFLSYLFFFLSFSLGVHFLSCPLLFWNCKISWKNIFVLFMFCIDIHSCIALCNVFNCMILALYKKKSLIIIYIINIIIIIIIIIVINIVHMCMFNGGQGSQGIYFNSRVFFVWREASVSYFLTV